MTVAALFVDEGGVYADLDGVEAWGVTRDARLYAGPYPVVAHPPCQRWGRYWHGGPSAKVRRIKGDDGGCFASALASVQRWGGVLEHPEASAAWDAFGIVRPPRTGGWTRMWRDEDTWWTCCVEQGWYGHRARKATWLLAKLSAGTVPPELIWGPSAGERLDEGFHSAEERRAARSAGIKPRKRLSTAENLATPIPFRELLLQISRGAA
jgi:hypothetical protein